MNFDEKIKSELENEAKILDAQLRHSEGVWALTMGAYKGSLSRWMMVITVVVFILTALMLWTGYAFFTSSTLDDRVFWGVCLLLSSAGQIATKQWTWMEMNRNSTLREIKRLELELQKMRHST